MTFRIVALVLALFAAAPAGAQEPVAMLEFDAAFGLELVSRGVEAAAVAPAVQDGLRITLPVRKATRKRIRTAGGFELRDRADDVSIMLKRITFAIAGRRVEVAGFALIDGIGYDRFAFADGRRKRDGRTILRLNGTAVAALNSQLQTTDFKEGQRIGKLTF